MLSERLQKILTDDNVDTTPDNAGRFTRHLWALMATKVADGLIDPKLVLAWLMTSVGAPGYLIGALVPVRESGALLPQMALAAWIQASRVRKYFWAAGSFLQGIAALGIASSALLLNGAFAGWAILGCLAVLSLARAACSASYKDVLARTVQSGARGTVSGTAATIAAMAVFGFAVLLAIGFIPLTLFAVSMAVAIAGAFWMAGAVILAGLDEPADDRAADSTRHLVSLVAPLRRDGELRIYIAARGLLIATALAPPFLVILSHGDTQDGLGNLGLLMIASSLAAITSSYVWGRWSDTSSRKTLVMSGALAAGALGGAAALGMSSDGLGAAWLAPAFLFIAQTAYEGVRAGRKTHLADMDTNGKKALYTALSNTMIGVFLLAGGGFGLIADAFGPAVVLAIFAAMSMAGATVAFGLREVQE